MPDRTSLRGSGARSPVERSAGSPAGPVNAVFTHSPEHTVTDAQKATQAANTARKELRALAIKEDSTAEAIEAKTKELNDLEARSAALSASEPVKPTEPTEPTEDAASSVR